MIIIKEIPSKETFTVRHPVLRKGKPLESCHFEGDDLPTTQHFGLFENDTIAGVVSIFKRNNPLFENTNQAQIRGMAVLDNYQKKGFGKLLIEHCENQLQQNEPTLLWFNARENAVVFYEKMGYKIVGNPFEIEGVGTHFVMYKKLNR